MAVPWSVWVWKRPYTIRPFGMHRALGYISSSDPVADSLALTVGLLSDVQRAGSTENLFWKLHDKTTQALANLGMRS